MKGKYNVFGGVSEKGKVSLKKYIKYIIAGYILCSFVLASTLVETGFLRNKNGQVVNTKVQMQFKIYNTPIGGNPVWDSSEMFVTVNQGLYSVELGTEANPINESNFSPTNDYYLEFSLAGDVFYQRELIGTTPRAIMANSSISANNALSAGKLDNMNISQFTNDAGYVNKDTPVVTACISLTSNFALDSQMLVGKTEAQLNVATAVTAGKLLSMNVGQFINDVGYLTALAILPTSSFALTSNYAFSADSLNGKKDKQLEVGTADIAISANALINMNISQFANDSGYLTAIDASTTINYAHNSALLEGKAASQLEVAIASKLSAMNIGQFANDSGYLTFNGIINTANIALTALSAQIVPWSGIENRPSTVAGYGITDIANQLVNTSSYALLAGAASTANFATMTNFASLASFASAANYASNTSLLGGKTEANLNVATAITANGLFNMKVSQFANDAGYLTSAGGIANAQHAISASYAQLATTADIVAWSGVQGTPTTVAGYGITDIAVQVVDNAKYAQEASTASIALTANYIDWNKIGNKPDLVSTDMVVNLAISASYAILASSANEVEWIKIKGVPTTVAGYGITDIALQIVNSANFAQLATTANAVAWGGIQGTPTTVVGYGITDIAAQVVDNAKYAQEASTASIALTANYIDWNKIGNKPDLVSTDMVVNLAVSASYAALSGASSSIDWSKILNNNHVVTSNYNGGAVISGTLTANAFVGNGEGLTGNVGFFKVTNATFSNGSLVRNFSDTFCKEESLIIINIISGVPSGVWSIETYDGGFSITSNVLETANTDFTYYVVK